jgi:hypothetical protein
VLPLLLACFSASDDAADPRGTPAERLDAALPGLASAAERALGKDALPALADLIDAADPSLVQLLLPKDDHRPLEELSGEAPSVRGAPRPPDLLSARAWLDGTVLRGEVTGRGVAEHGAWLQLDTRGGPAPDLFVGVADEDAVRVATMDDWAYGPQTALAGSSRVSADTVRFAVDLAPTGRVRAGDGGAAVAIVRDATTWDPGPAGALVPQKPDALTILGALLDAAAKPGDDAHVDVLDDPDLAVAVALGFAPWLRWVAPEVRATVAEDAVERFAYGVELDPWLEAAGAQWRFASLPAGAKLVWASPGAQAVSYGAMPVARAAAPLSLARYRFAVPDADTLAAYRDGMPLDPDPFTTAGLRDDAIWARLRYRASAEAMEAVCEAGLVSHNRCAAEASERAHRADLGVVDGVRVPLDGGVSATHQLGVLEREGEFVGDCATATTVALTAFASVGLPGVALGYAGPSFDFPTHDLPLVLIGDRFTSPQSTPSQRWAADTTWVYAHPPVLSGVHGGTLATEPAGAFARGGGVAGGRTTYGALGAWLDAGVPLSTVVGWAREGARGEWPTVGL